MNDDFKNYIQLLIDNKDKITHLPERDIHNLLDYITNLQQENEKWFAVAKDFEMEAHDLWNKNNELEEAQKNFEKQFIKEMDYKSRIEKAVEYMRKHIEKCNIDGYEGKFDNFDIFTKPQELLNILEGKSDE